MWQFWRDRGGTFTDIVAKNKKGKSSFKVFSEIFILKNKAVQPKTKAIFAIFEPIIFPKTMSLLSLKIASKLTNNSGEDVAKDTIVIPATSLEILNLVARFTDPRTSSSPPKYKRTNPKIKNSKEFIIYFLSHL